MYGIFGAKLSAESHTVFWQHAALVAVDSMSPASMRALRACEPVMMR